MVRNYVSHPGTKFWVIFGILLKFGRNFSLQSTKVVLDHNVCGQIRTDACILGHASGLQRTDDHRFAVENRVPGRRGDGVRHHRSPAAPRPGHRPTLGRSPCRHRFGLLTFFPLFFSPTFYALQSCSPSCPQQGMSSTLSANANSARSHWPRVARSLIP